ncbi:MAG: sodium:alanine symporter family protein [Chlamydiia bacterium]|nr:sodium:alanine symporter family protein [Chlamydiia bacterium]
MMQILNFFNDKLTLYLVFPAVLLSGFYLTIRLKAVQVFRLKMSFKEIFFSQDKGEGNVSHYQAVSSVLAGSFGTGNISGMAVALTLGGPGALVWMWVFAFLGAAIQYASCLLGVKYRRKNEKGDYVGGPMYYLRDGLGLKRVASCFAILVICAGLACGNLVQMNSIALPLAKIGIAPWISGSVIAFFVALVILGRSERLSLVASSIVPLMALLYLGGAAVILILNFDKVGSALLLILTSAFKNGDPFFGGAAGWGMAQAMISGFDRAIFATDAGTGSVPILQANARTRDPVIDGVVTLLAPFLVMLVCTATALVILVTGEMGKAESTNLVLGAFQRVFGFNMGGLIVIFSLVLFAYTTILTWGTCALRAFEFLLGTKGSKIVQLGYIALVPIGAFMKVGTVWLIADMTLSLMLLLNLFGIFGLRKEIIVDTKEFFFDKMKA